MASTESPTERTITSTTGTFEGRGGVRLHYRWDEVSPPRAVVVVVHGIAEHGGRYDHVASALTAAGFGCLRVDLRGHGRSAGRRVYVERFDEYVGDTLAGVRFVRDRQPGVPIFALGHSMGGLVAILLALDHPDTLAGLALSSPGLRAKVHIPAWKDALGRIMSRLVPTLAIPTGIPPTSVSRDPAVVKAYQADPLVTTKATARWYTEYLAAQARAMGDAPRLRTPTLMLVAGSDVLVDPEASQAFFDGLGAQDKTFQPYPDLYHEVFNEPERDAVIADLLAWLRERGGA